MKNLLLQYLENDSRLTYEQLALMLDKDEGDIKAAIEQYEKEKVIVGYKALIDWDKTEREYVTAMIELKIIPQKDHGFDGIAKKICNFPEVRSLFLMSGSYDLSVLIEGKTMREVALFVAEKLATLEDVISTSTHFMLRKYKDNNVIYGAVPVDERGNII